MHACTFASVLSAKDEPCVLNVKMSRIPAAKREKRGGGDGQEGDET